MINNAFMIKKNAVNSTSWTPYITLNNAPLRPFAVLCDPLRPLRSFAILCGKYQYPSKASSASSLWRHQHFAKNGGRSHLRSVFIAISNFCQRSPTALKFCTSTDKYVHNTYTNFQKATSILRAFLRTRLLSNELNPSFLFVQRMIIWIICWIDAFMCLKSSETINN